MILRLLLQALQIIVQLYRRRRSARRVNDHPILPPPSSGQATIHCCLTRPQVSPKGTCRQRRLATTWVMSGQLLTVRPRRKGGLTGAGGCEARPPHGVQPCGDRSHTAVVGRRCTTTDGRTEVHTSISFMAVFMKPRRREGRRTIIKYLCSCIVL